MKADSGSELIRCFYRFKLLSLLPPSVSIVKPLKSTGFDELPKGKGNEEISNILLYKH